MHSYTIMRFPKHFFVLYYFANTFTYYKKTFEEGSPRTEEQHMLYISSWRTPCFYSQM